MQRYDLDPCGLTDGEYTCNASMMPCDDGDYVRHEDAKASVDLVKKIRGIVDTSPGQRDDILVERLLEALHDSSAGCIRE